MTACTKQNSWKWLSIQPDQSHLNHVTWTISWATCWRTNFTT